MSNPNFCVHPFTHISLDCETPHLMPNTPPGISDIHPRALERDYSLLQSFLHHDGEPAFGS
jgi:hypothetical protein